MKLEKSDTEMFEILKTTFGDQCLNLSIVFNWYKVFEDGREDFENDRRIDLISNTKTNENLHRVTRKFVL